MSFTTALADLPYESAALLGAGAGCGAPRGGAGAGAGAGVGVGVVVVSGGSRLLWHVRISDAAAPRVHVLLLQQIADCLHGIRCNLCNHLVF